MICYIQSKGDVDFTRCLTIHLVKCLAPHTSMYTYLEANNQYCGNGHHIRKCLLLCRVSITSCEQTMAKQQISLSQWLVSGATPPSKKAKVHYNTEDNLSLSELVSHSQTPPIRIVGVYLKYFQVEADN